jgi:hypothetical protein
MHNLINSAAALIATRNPSLASCFRNQPLRRVDLAHAFAAGFTGGDTSKDIHPEAMLILRVAYADRESRRLAA